MNAPAASPNFLASLNSQQRAAAGHPSGPLLVVAGAGTGKTKTLAARVAALIRAGADPGRILLLTFTRRAAGEMIRRAGQVVGEAVARSVWGGTFHAVAHRLLRQYHRPLGLAANFTVLDQGDAEDLLHLIRTDLGLHTAATRFPQKSTLLAVYSRCVNTGSPLGQVLSSAYPWCAEHREALGKVFTEYGERKAARHLLDYDDLLLYWQQALADSGTGTLIARQFKHVLVDEYQDTNPAQAAILQRLWAGMTGEAAEANDRAGAADGPSIMVVGDDAQSIYAFRGATVDNILNFPEQFPGTMVVTLEQNYRSVTPILEASNAVMSYARRRYTKNLWSERASDQKPVQVTCTDELAQAHFVVEKLLAHREEGEPLTKQAVLFRAGQNSDALEVELARRNIPFVKWGGLKFLETAHVKDLLAFLRIAENPDDELSWMRVLQLLDGIGPGKARQAVRHVRDRAEGPEGLLTWAAPAVAREAAAQLAGMLSALSSSPEMPVAAQVERVRRFYGPLLDRLYEQPEMRRRDLDQLELLAGQAAGRAAFLVDLTLDPPASTGDLAGPALLDEEYVVLSTIHSAKGCEWNVVYVIHAADGVIPSDLSQGEAELEEERRLLYVAMTRARDRLYVTFPLRYYHRKHARADAHSYAQLSRYIPPELFPRFERTGYGFTEPETAAVPAPAVPVAEDVKSRVKRLWQ
jgi:DNA helicase-2/ATP-dependent DNA helicase PcrA